MTAIASASSFILFIIKLRVSYYKRVVAKPPAAPYTQVRQSGDFLLVPNTTSSYLVFIRLDLVHQGCKLAEIGILIYNHKGKEEQPDWF